MYLNQHKNSLIINPAEMSLTGPKVVQIRLITKQDQYALQDVAYTVDIYSTSADLNKLVNTLLQKSHIKPVDFDFLVADQFLENTLFDHLQNRTISVENDVPVEYLEKYPAPEPQECLLHDDWVSAVKIDKKWILSGCYDNTINLWTASGSHVLTIPGHSMPIKALTWVSLDDKKGQFLSASQDQTVFLWEWNILENSVHPLHEYKGHQRGIDCVEINSDFTKFATGSWDTVLKVWSAETKENTDDSSIIYNAKHGSTRTPLLSLQGHKENISAVQWINAETILSSSWDQTLKIWNLNIEGIQSEVTANKSFFDVSYSPLNRLIITASADKNLRLYDTRSNHNSVVASTFIGHTQWVQSVEWSKSEEHLFISGAYDNKIKLWDSRSPKAPLYDLFAHSDKVLDVDWSNPKYVVSGGADNTVRIFKSK